MSIIKFSKREDYGTDYNVQLINFEGISLLQLSFSYNDYPSWPYLQIKSGMGDILDVLFCAYKFGFDITILGRTWNFDRLNYSTFEENDVDLG